MIFNQGVVVQDTSTANTAAVQNAGVFVRGQSSLIINQTNTALAPDLNATQNPVWPRTQNGAFRRPSPARFVGRRAARLVSFNSNFCDGVLFDGASSKTQSTLTGVTASFNGIVPVPPPSFPIKTQNATYGSGVHVANAAPLLKVRGSNFLGNATAGVRVTTNQSTNLGLMDFGVDTGKNTLQSTTQPNLAAGVCIEVGAVATVPTPMPMRGNVWNSLDCSMTQAAKLGDLVDAHCGGSQTPIVWSTANTVDVSKCQAQ